jgi:hypothetical protein
MGGRGGGGGRETHLIDVAVDILANSLGVFAIEDEDTHLQRNVATTINNIHTRVLLLRHLAHNQREALRYLHTLVA